MSVKITLVENMLIEILSNIILMNTLSKKTLVQLKNLNYFSKKRSKEDEANLIAFLSEIRLINKIIDMRKSNQQTSIHKGYVSTLIDFILTLLTTNNFNDVSLPDNP